MTARVKTAAVAGCMLAICSCGGVRRAQNGGEPERQLAAATTGGDVARVSQLLASGANPNLVVRVSGDTQSAWFLALSQLRERRSETVEIVKAMLKSGADANEVWGTNVRSGPRESAFKRFFSQGGTRQAGFGSDQPLNLVMFHPVVDVVRALVAAGLNPRYGAAALVDAVETQNAEIVHALVEAGVNVNSQPGALTPLVAAIEARDLALMTYLEQHGAREKP